MIANAPNAAGNDVIPIIPMIPASTAIPVTRKAWRVSCFLSEFFWSIIVCYR